MEMAKLSKKKKQKIADKIYDYIKVNGCKTLKKIYDFVTVNKIAGRRGVQRQFLGMLLRGDTRFYVKEKRRINDGHSRNIVSIWDITDNLGK
jgi:hypothetical protein